MTLHTNTTGGPHDRPQGPEVRRSRTGHTPCDTEGCDRSPARGHPLFRANPRGEPGIFLCDQHMREHMEARR